MESLPQAASAEHLTLALRRSGVLGAASAGCKRRASFAFGTAWIAIAGPGFPAGSGGVKQRYFTVLSGVRAILRTAWLHHYVVLRTL
jgi:hypothetical protein